jgi:hypothetical protein
MTTSQQLKAMEQLYAIADAELNSDQVVHRRFEQLRARHKQYKSLLAQSFFSIVKNISLRENFNNFGIWDFQIRQICNTIAETWIHQHEADLHKILVTKGS